MNERTMELHCICPICKEEQTVFIRPEDYDEFKSPNRRHVQNIFPYLAPAERELFLTGICGKCFEKMFEEDESEEEAL